MNRDYGISTPPTTRTPLLRAEIVRNLSEHLLALRHFTARWDRREAPELYFRMGSGEVRCTLPRRPAEGRPSPRRPLPRRYSAHLPQLSAVVKQPYAHHGLNRQHQPTQPRASDATTLATMGTVDVLHGHLVGINIKVSHGI